MGKSELSDYSQLLLSIYRSAQHLPVAEFQDTILNDADSMRPSSGDGLFEHLAPHLMQALAINRLVHLDRRTGESRTHWCVAIVDVKGVIYHADKRFRELVGKEWAGITENSVPSGLTEKLVGTDDHISGKHVVVKRTLEHGLLFLKARARAPVDSLTTREYMVAKLLASGLSQKEVAARLERSPETIRSQLKVIFSKLGINSVTLLPGHLALRD